MCSTSCKFRLFHRTKYIKFGKCDVKLNNPGTLDLTAHITTFNLDFGLTLNNAKWIRFVVFQTFPSLLLFPFSRIFPPLTAQDSLSEHQTSIDNTNHQVFDAWSLRLCRRRKRGERGAVGKIERQSVGRWRTRCCLAAAHGAHCTESTPGLSVSLDTHILTHRMREAPLAYALKCVIRLSPSRF